MTTMLFLQLSVLALGSGLLGLACGRYLWPRQVGATGPHLRQTSAPTDLEPALTELETRLRASESEVEALRQAMASDLPDRH